MTIEELGRRAVACKHWRWMPGMLVQPLNSRTAVVEEEYVYDKDWSMKRRESDDLHPDLSDPATLGCLLALMREAWGVERACVWWNSHDNAWVADVRPRNAVFVRNTEAHALVAALEAAP